MSTAAQKQLEEYRKRQSQRYQKIEEQEYKQQDGDNEGVSLKQDDEERRKKQEQEDLELAKQIQEELEMESMRQNQNNMNSAQNQHLGNFYQNQFNPHEFTNQKQQIANATHAPSNGGAMNENIHSNNGSNNINYYDAPVSALNNVPHHNLQSPPSHNNDNYMAYDPLGAQNEFHGNGMNGDYGGQYDENGVRTGDAIKVDKLIPDENDIIMDEVRYQQFLLQQQLLMSEIEHRKKSTLQGNNNGGSQRGRRQTNRGANAVGETAGVSTQPLLDIESGTQQQQQQRETYGQRRRSTLQLNSDINQEQSQQINQQNRKRLYIILGFSALLIMAYVLFIVFVVA